MNVECMNCGNIYDVQVHNMICPKCKGRGGFSQQPKMKTIEGYLHAHLGDTLIHKESKNEFKIKEIQTEGLIAITTKVIPEGLLGKRVYISNKEIQEYEAKK